MAVDRCVVGLDVLGRHQEEAGELVRLLFHLLRWLSTVHDQVPKLVRQSEAIAIRRQRGVQEDQGGDVRLAFNALIESAVTGLKGRESGLFIWSFNLRLACRSCR